MNNKLANYVICILGSLIPSLVYGQAAPEHHVWQDKRAFEPMSHTAQAITGSIKLSGNPKFAVLGSKMRITFGNGKSVKLTSVGAFWSDWTITNSTKVTAEVFRLDHDPGKLLQGNTLCGGLMKDPARYIVFYEELFVDETQFLGVSVYSSKTVPENSNSPGPCGTFNFIIN